VLIFTQFADTARYLAREARKAGITHVEVATGASADPYALACRFSPKSNNKTMSKADEVRVLICTDVLSEGQNLQDSNVVVNFDLPWAIIRLIQRAGRVDRIGQRAEEIHCYSFLPADGVEQLIQLRSRIRQRLQENAEVVGTDEAFFEDDEATTIRDLYTEQARGCWTTPTMRWTWPPTPGRSGNRPRKTTPTWPAPWNPCRRWCIRPRPLKLDESRFPLLGADAAEGGALVYVKSPEGNDHLAWVGRTARP
jgi:hypothetical protein